jgi:thioester reductase-like protein
MIEGKIRVIDRIKSVFKLSLGVYVAPEALERIYIQSHYVLQIFIWGCDTMANVAAVVVPSESLAIELLSHPDGCEESTHRHILCDASGPYAQRAKQLILNDFDKIATKESLKPWERIRTIIVESHTFEPSNGFLTTNGKLRRAALIMRYRDFLSGSVSSLNDRRDDTVSDHVIKDPTRLNQRDYGGLCSGIYEILMEVMTQNGNVKEDDLMADLTHDTTLSSLGLNSMSLAFLSSRLHDRFGIKLNLPTLARLESLSQLQDAVFGTLPDFLIDDQKDGGDSFGVDFWKNEVESSWEYCLRNTPKVLPQSTAEISSPLLNLAPNAKRDILLTGATGFVGAYLLCELLEAEYFKESNIICLVRCESSHYKDAHSRLMACLADYGINLNVRLGSEEYVNRIIAIQSEISEPLFGLSPKLYDEIHKRIHFIFHCAAQVNSIYPYAFMKKANVFGTAHVLQFALADRIHPKKVCHISTISVLDGQIRDETLDVHDTHLSKSSGYAQSKWVAEQLVKKASDIGCFCEVFRLGTIAGKNPHDFINMLMLGLANLGEVSTDKDSPLPQAFLLANVEWAAEAVVAIFGRKSSSVEASSPSHANVYHIIGEKYLSLEWFVQSIEFVLEKKLTKVPHIVFRNSISSLEPTSPLFPFKSTLSTGKNFKSVVRPSDCNTLNFIREPVVTSENQSHSHNDNPSSGVIQMRYSRHISQDDFSKTFNWMKIHFKPREMKTQIRNKK